MDSHTPLLRYSDTFLDPHNFGRNSNRNPAFGNRVQDNRISTDLSVITNRNLPDQDRARADGHTIPQNRRRSSGMAVADSDMMMQLAIAAEYCIAIDHNTAEMINHQARPDFG